MGRGALLEEEGFRQSLCSVILMCILLNELPCNALRVPFPSLTRWNGALDLPGSPGTCCRLLSDLRGDRNLHSCSPIETPRCFFSVTSPPEGGGFLLSGSHHPTENTLRREVLNLLGVRDNLPVIVTGVKSSLKWTWW